MSDIRSSDYSVKELPIRRLLAAKWINSAPKLKGVPNLDYLRLDWTALGRKKAKALLDILGELDYRPGGTNKKNGELDFLYTFLSGEK